MDYSAVVYSLDFFMEENGVNMGNRIIVDFDKKKGKMKPMHGVGQPPFYGLDFSMFEYLKAAKIPYSRLHDVGGPYGRNQFVDIPNLFRDFDANPFDPESYDFAFTDLLITALVEHGVEPFFRLGVSIENHVKVKAYRVFPPKDNLKWAQICEGVIKHYTEGWANGFHYNIEYWEIWNEPEGKQMWMGTKEQYFSLYEVTSKYLKERFPHLKIGGYASCGFYAIEKEYNADFANIGKTVEYYYQYIQDFLKFVKDNNCPLDFFSWHSYDSIINNVHYAKHARELLDRSGFVNTEQILDEWNLKPDLRGTIKHAVLTGAMMIALQDTDLSSAMFYDARCGVGIYSGMFNPLTQKPFPAYYSFLAFSELYIRKNQVDVTADIPGVYVCAAKSDTGCLVIVNTNDEEVCYSLDVLGKCNLDKCTMISDGCIWEETPFLDKLPPQSLICIYFN